MHRKQPSSTAHLLTIPETARRLSVSERFVWKLLSTRRLKAVKIGRCTRVSVQSVDALLDEAGGGQ